MDNGKREYNRRAIPYIRVDTLTANKHQPYISSSSSEESIPIDAPIVRQSRCSVDIDIVPMELGENVAVNGIDTHSNAYSECRESIQDIDDW